MRVLTGVARATGSSILTTLLACGGSASSPSTPPTAYETRASAHFIFRHTALDTASIAQPAATLESHVGRITGSLAVASMPTVTVTLYADRTALQEAVRSQAGTLPSFASGLVTGVDQIHILSPNLASAWTYERGVTAIVHEFAHTVSLRLNPTIATRGGSGRPSHCTRPGSSSIRAPCLT